MVYFLDVKSKDDFIVHYSVFSEDARQRSLVLLSFYFREIPASEKPAMYIQEAIVEAQLGVDYLSSIHFSGFK